MSKSEAQTRSELIDQQLALAGWNVKDPTWVVEEFDILTELPHGVAEPRTPKEFLKIDFPRVPYPNNAETFWQLVALGGELRKIHLLETTATSTVSYPVAGNHVVGNIHFEPDVSEDAVNCRGGKVYINETQYFEHVPELAWGFYIGGYQPAQKWLKDRKGRALSFEDIQHYQKIIHALCETDRLMQLIDQTGLVQ